MDFSRRHFLSAGSLLTASSVLPLAVTAGEARDEKHYSGMLNVRDFGAKGDLSLIHI